MRLELTVAVDPHVLARQIDLVAERLGRLRRRHRFVAQACDLVAQQSHMRLKSAGDGDVLGLLVARGRGHASLVLLGLFGQLALRLALHGQLALEVVDAFVLRNHAVEQ